jgi:HAMP domain-containing protein
LSDSGAGSISTNGVVRTILITSFIVALLIGAGGSYFLLHERAVQRTAAEAGRLLTVATAVRSYTTEQIVPIVRDDTRFHAVTVPAFAAQSVYRIVQGSYSGYIYREPALKPTNLDDLPAPFEVELLNRFRSNPEVKELSGVRNDGKENVYYLARPIRAQEACLQCHDTPQRAPASMVAKYGPNNGFGWKLNEVVAMQSLTVPAAAELQETGEIAMMLAGGLLIVFVITYFVLTLSIDSLVVRPLRALAKAADAASTGNDTNAPLPASGTHEIRSIAAAVERLRTSLRKSMRRLSNGKS